MTGEDLEGFVLEVLPHEGDEIESLERVGLGPEAFEQNVTRRGTRVPRLADDPAVAARRLGGHLRDLVRAIQDEPARAVRGTAPGTRGRSP